MLFSSRFTLLVVVAACGCAAAGCRSLSGPGDPSAVRLPGLRDSDHRGSGSVVTAAELNAIEAQAQYATALVHESNGEADAALEAFRLAALRDPTNETLVLEVSRRLLQAKQPEKALELIQGAMRQSRSRPSPNILARLGVIQFQLGNVEEAIAANRTAIGRDPASLVSYQNLFLIYLQTNRPADALKVLDEAAKVPQTSPEFLIRVGELYGTFGLQNPAQRDAVFARGVDVLKRAATGIPADAQLRLRLADAFNTLGQTTESAAIYRDVLGELEEHPFMRDAIRAKLMDVYLRGRNIKEAAEQLEEVVRENPTDIQAHSMLADIYETQTNYVGAAEALSKVVLLNPDDEKAYINLARTQLSLEKPEEALRTLERARQKFEENPFVEYFSAVAFTIGDDYTNALKHFERAEALAAAKPTGAALLRDFFYFQMGASCERVGQFERAEQYFEKCLELSPNYDEAQNYLGYMLAERGLKLDRAKELIERALVAEPTNAAYLDSMGWVLFKMDKPQEALTYLLDAIKNSEEEDATLWDHLGDVYDALHQPDKAREAWTKSLGLEPNDRVRQKLQGTQVGTSGE